MNPNIAHIVYASDDRFAEILGVSLVSLYENSIDMEELVVYILDSGIKDENKSRIESVSQMYFRTPPVWIPAQDISKVLSMKVTVDRGSLSQYARLLVSSEIPDAFGRILYLDCDTIICKSIRELWNLDMKEKTVAALMDAFSKHYRTNIGLSPDDVMFNSGVMLIDMTRWREKCYEDKLLRFIQLHNGRIQQGDQGVLNAILSDDVYCFEPKFNSVTIFYDFTYEDMLIYRKPPTFYTKEEIQGAIENPFIIHFTTSFLSRRPWMKGSRHKYVGLWLNYKEMSPWRTNALRDDYRPVWKQYGVRLYSLIPQKMALHLAGMLQAYIRPQINRVLLNKKLIGVKDRREGQINI